MLKWCVYRDPGLILNTTKCLSGYNMDLGVPRLRNSTATVRSEKAVCMNFTGGLELRTQP